MGTVLQKIMETKLQEVAKARQALPDGQLREALDHAAAVRNFFDAVAEPGPIHLIAEVKKASPSKGLIRADFDPVDIARAYQQHGATCISVLTDQPFFQGHLDDLRAVRGAVTVPLLRKDFILDRYQLLEARVHGADAVLLIAECLDDCLLRSLHNETLELGMTPLVELYDEANLPRVLEAGAVLVGINNRNLHTFATDLDHVLRLRDQIPDDVVLVAESGIHNREDAERLESAGIQAMLVGEHLMAQPDVGQAVTRLLGRS